MFGDLVLRAKNHGDNVRAESKRKEEIQILIRETVESFLPEIRELGFIEVKYWSLVPTSFELRLQTRRGYSEQKMTHNMALDSLSSSINYGSGANSAKGKQFKFNYDMSDPQIIGVVKHALRALIGDALKSLEFCKAKGWA